MDSRLRGKDIGERNERSDTPAHQAGIACSLMGMGLGGILGSGDITD